jgi:hypothetical protein
MNGSSCRATVYALYLPNQFLMMHQLFIMLAVCLTAIPTAILVYYFVLPRRPKGNDDGSNGKWSGVLGNATVKTVLHHLVAWGMLIPFWIVAPGRVIDAFGVQNLNVRFTLAAMIPTQCLFRTLESLYGFTPTPTHSRSFAFIFAAPTCRTKEKKLYPLRIRRGISTLPKVARDQRRPPQPAPRQKLAMPICCVNLDTLSSTGGVMSLLHAASDEQWPKYALGLASTPAGLYEWSSLWNVQQCKVLTGREVEPISDDALFQSTSPSDYLGRRWKFLKNGVYKPVRFVGCGPRWLTISAPFVASALFHEWLLPHVFYNYPNTHGIATAFFLWQAMLVAIEAETVVVPSRTVVAGSTKPRSRQSWRLLPRQVQTALAGLGLPPAHWFMDSYIRSNLFADLQVLLPMILPVNGTVPMAQ